MPTCSFLDAGCKVNQYETCALRQKYASEGYDEVSPGAPSDICVINTCTVTQDAERKSRSLIRRALKNNPDATLIVTGCLVERHNNPLPSSRRIRIMGNREKQEAIRESRISAFSNHTRAFLKIQDGCDNFCSYCVVPYARGRSRSRKLNAIVEEAAALVSAGYKELVLSGICLGGYRSEEAGGAGLLEVISALERLEGLLRIRLSSIEPRYIEDCLLSAMAKSKKLCRHLHMPFQSGDDDLLRRMNRPYTKRRYLEIVEKAKYALPDIAITTDMMVGFPGEEEKSFNNTLEFLKEINPAKTHIFTYSRREGTAASNFSGEVSHPIVKKRRAIIEDLSKKLAYNYKSKYINRTVEVLIEEFKSNRNNGANGYTSNYIKVHLSAPLTYINKIVPAKIVKITPDFVSANLI